MKNKLKWFNKTIVRKKVQKFVCFLMKGVKIDQFS